MVHIISFQENKQVRQLNSGLITIYSIKNVRAVLLFIIQVLSSNLPITSTYPHSLILCCSLGDYE